MAGEEWFSTDYGKGLSQVMKNSWVRAFVDAEEYYADLRSEVEATDSSGQICWIGFDGSGDTPIPTAPTAEAEKRFAPRGPVAGDTPWIDLLRSASRDRSVPIRVLLNLHPSPRPTDRYKGANFTLVETLNTLGTCAAINDFRFLHVNGTHHQKLVLVYNSKGLIAYCGTCDVEKQRINDRWCEVQLKVLGDAAGELYAIFQRRWSEHTQVLAGLGSVKSYLKPLSQLKTTAPASGNFLVQTATTYGNPERGNPFVWFARLIDTPLAQVVNRPHRLTWGVGPVSYSLGNDFFIEKEPAAPPLIREARAQSRQYGFAPKGHTGIYHQLEKAIATARRFIYMEDQYLVCDKPMGPYKPMLDLLVAKVKEEGFKKLILFCTRVDDINEEFQGTAWAHRSQFINALVSAAHDKVVVCQYKTKGAVGAPGDGWRGLFYIHSKTWIVDDEYLVTGSANCNRRGYSHDSELDIGVYDKDKRFVRDLRIKLWKRRLNTEGMSRSPLQDRDLVDFLAAAKYWERPDTWGLAIQSNRVGSLGPSRHPDLNLASYKAKVTAEPGISPVVLDLIDRIKMDGLWDLAVDPDGT